MRTATTPSAWTIRSPDRGWPLAVVPGPAELLRITEPGPEVFDPWSNGLAAVGHLHVQRRICFNVQGAVSVPRWVKGVAVSKYDHLDKVELTRLLERRDAERQLGLVWERDDIDVDAAVNDDYVALTLDESLSFGSDGRTDGSILMHILARGATSS